MADRKYRKMALLAKIEGTYGVDAVPTGAADAMQVNDVTFTPMAGGEESRDLMLPWLGHQGVELTNNHAILEFSVEIAGSGAAGTAPAYGPLLRACAMAETVNAGVSVVYSPVSAGEEAVSIYFNMDGTNHILLGARGSMSMDFTPSRIPRYRFRMMGLLGTIADTALPAADLSGFKRGRHVNKARTTMTLHGVNQTAQPCETLSLDLGVQVEPRFLIGEELITITDRRVTGSVTVAARLLAVKNWFAAASDRTAGALQLVHGTAAGDIVQIDAPAVEIGRPGTGQTQGNLNYALPLYLTPTGAGDDELTITVK